MLTLFFLCEDCGETVHSFYMTCVRKCERNPGRSKSQSDESQRFGPHDLAKPGQVFIAYGGVSKQPTESPAC